MRNSLVIAAFIASLLTPVSITFADTASATTRGETIRQLAEEEQNVSELFSMCCWASGRSGFHYCAEYGICARDSAETCVGVGAAEGMRRNCSSGGPDRDASPSR